MPLKLQAGHQEDQLATRLGQGPDGKFPAGQYASLSVGWGRAAGRGRRGGGRLPSHWARSRTLWLPSKYLNERFHTAVK